MPFAEPGTLEIRMQFTQSYQQVENVYHFKRNNPEATATDLTELGDTFAGWWISALRGRVADDVILRRVLVTQIDRAGGLEAESTAGLPSTGAGGTALPNNVSLAVKWGTGHAGRSFRGRTFHIGLPIAGVTQNTVNGGHLSDLVGAYNELRTALDNIVLAGEMCVLSKISSGIERDPAICTPISGLSINPTIDSQRRRLPERGS